MIASQHVHAQAVKTRLGEEAWDQSFSRHRRGVLQQTPPFHTAGLVPGLFAETHPGKTISIVHVVFDFRVHCGDKIMARFVIPLSDRFLSSSGTFRRVA